MDYHVDGDPGVTLAAPGGGVGSYMSLLGNRSLSLNVTTTSNASGANFSGDYDYACVFLVDPDYVLRSHLVFFYSSVLLVVIGLIGNAMSLMVFSSKEMRTQSSNVYLLVLSISDSCYLISVCGRLWSNFRCMFFYEYKAIDILSTTEIGCKLFQFLQDLFSDYSTCLILAFTIERTVAVYLPIRFKELCTVYRARLSCAIIFIITAVSISPYHILYMGLYRDYEVCTVREGMEDNFTIGYVVETTAFRIVPVIVIAILNVFIIIKVSKITQDKRRQGRKSTKAAACSSVSPGKNGVHAPKRRKSRKEDKSMQLTVMLILVSSSYVVLYFPVLIMFVLYKLERSHILRLNEFDTIVAKNYTQAPYVAGFAVNFFLYTVSGQVFRDQLRAIVCSCWRRKEHRNGYLPTTADTEV